MRPTSTAELSIRRDLDNAMRGIVTSAVQDGVLEYFRTVQRHRRTIAPLDVQLRD